MRRTRTYEELMKASGHLFYEIQMMNETARLNYSHGSVENNSIIESFGIHSRVVLQFLKNTRELSTNS